MRQAGPQLRKFARRCTASHRGIMRPTYEGAEIERYFEPAESFRGGTAAQSCDSLQHLRIIESARRRYCAL